jgi:hypothetical protein
MTSFEKRGYQGSSMSCPHCGEAARFVAYRARTLTALMGAIRIERAYYHCRHCHRGTCPSEAVWGLSAADLTPGALEVVSMAGVLGSFATAAEDVLRRLSGLRVSEATVQRQTEMVGKDVGDRLNAGQLFGPATPWAWHRDAEGTTCAYLAIDATGVPQQGPGARAAEGKMATVAMIYNPIPESRQRWAKPTAPRPPWQVRYRTGMHGQAGLGEPLHRQAAQVGFGQAERWIALSDGGAGLEDWLRLHFPRVEAVILDFYHASEHLAELAKAWHSPGTEAAELQHQVWAHRLKQEGGQAVLDELRGLAPPARESVREVWRATVTYFENQVHRMDYPSYRAQGWQIGSGPVEAGCKTVIGQRLKGTGMRWGRSGSDGVAHLRALFLSERGQWAAYWAHRQKAA